jgi:hypothetical protein
MTKGVLCPKCGEKGSLHWRWVLNPKQKRYQPYYYVAHYQGKGKYVKWHYVPRAVAEEILRSYGIPKPEPGPEAKPGIINKIKKVLRGDRK